MTETRRPDAGVSLIEVLVVLAILGALSGAVVLGAGGSGSATAEAEARRLADRLQRAADEALVTGVPRALVCDASVYLFVAWDDGADAWGAASRILAEAHALPSGLALAGPEEAVPVVIAPEAAAAAAFTVRGPDATWTVAFDGLTARAASEGG